VLASLPTRPAPERTGVAYREDEERRQALRWTERVRSARC